MATKRKDGRLQSSVTVTNYFTGEKKRIFVYGYTEKEIEAEKRRVAKEAEKAILTAAEPSLEEWFPICLNSKMANGDINEVTYESYEIKMRRHVIPNLPKDIKLSEVKPFHIKHIIENINGSRTKNYVYTILNMMFKEALFEKLVNTNPCEFVRKPKHKSTHARVLTPEQYRELLSAVEGTQWEHLLIFTIHTGCRRSEVSALKWSDIDFERKTAEIRSAMKETKRQGVHEGSTKTAYSVRTLLLTDEVIDTLRQWKKALRTNLMKVGAYLDEAGFVFRSNEDPRKPLTPQAITTKIGTLRRKLQLPDRICMHSLRHTYATSLAEQNVQIKKIQLTIGHASAAFTADTYIHSTPDMMSGIQEANDVIAQKFKMSK